MKKNLFSIKRKFSRKSFLDTLTVMLISFQSDKGGGRFGLLPRAFFKQVVLQVCAVLMQF